MGKLLQIVEQTGGGKWYTTKNIQASELRVYLAHIAAKEDLE
jgi:hypothetical protein